MSYFAGSQRKTKWGKMGCPSPCEYNPTLSNSRSFACAPFGSTTKLNRSLTLNKETKIQPALYSQQDFYSINNANFKIKPQHQISSVFKSQTTRFKNKLAENPGPGEYNVRKSILNQSKSLNTLSHFQPHQMKPTVPSIPADNLGWREDQNNQMKKVQPADHQPTPFNPNPHSSLNNKGVTTWKAGKIARREEEKVPGPGDYNNNEKLKGSKSVTSCFASTTDRFGVTKKIKEVKCPGPGSYNSHGIKKNSFNKSSQGYFNSKTTRFQKDSIDAVIGPGAYFNEKKKSQSVNNMRRFYHKQEDQVLQKVVQRSTMFQPKEKYPGPGQYKNNHGISYQLNKMLIRKQTTHVLPQQKRTVFQDKEIVANPGPGTYQTPVKKAKQSGGKLYKKAEVINLKQQEAPTPSPAEYTNLRGTIEQKVKKMNSKLTLTQQKPFNSGTQRFRHYSTKKDQQFAIEEDPEEEVKIPRQQQMQMMKGENKKVKRLVMTMIKVRVPFGISSNKYDEKQTNYEGPDFYDKPKEWIKTSYNIKGKIQ